MVPEQRTFHKRRFFMNKVFKNAGLALGLVFAGSLFAQEETVSSGEDVSNDWHVSIGLSYRNFKKPKFSSSSTKSGIVAVTNDGRSYEIDTNVNDGGSGYIAGLEGYTPRTIDVVTTVGGSGSAKGDYSNLEQTGLVLGFEYALTQSDSISLNLAANFQYFMLDSAGGATVSGGSTTYTYPIVLGSLGPIGWPSQNSYGAPAGAVRTDMDLELYVFDLGLSVSYEFENSIVLELAAGPSLSVADINTSAKASGARTRHDDDLETEFGFYVSGGIAYWFSEKMGVSFDLRYDNAFGEVGTKYVSQNLDAFSGQLQVLFRF